MIIKLENNKLNFIDEDDNFIGYEIRTESFRFELKKEKDTILQYSNNLFPKTTLNFVLPGIKLLMETINPLFLDCDNSISVQLSADYTLEVVECAGYYSSIKEIMRGQND